MTSIRPPEGMPVRVPLNPQQLKARAQIARIWRETGRHSGDVDLLASDDEWRFLEELLLARPED